MNEHMWDIKAASYGGAISGQAEDPTGISENSAENRSLTIMAHTLICDHEDEGFETSIGPLKH